jgi:arylsulfatase A-like enzyme
VNDRDMLDHFVDWLSAKDAENQPVFASVFTITNHHPWEVPSHFTSYAEQPAYLRTFAYTDDCVGRFINALHARGLAEKTIIWILGDTGQPHGEHDGNHSLLNHMHEESVHIPLLLYAPGRLTQPMNRTEVGSQIDLLPTMMDVLDMNGAHHAMGRSLARNLPVRSAFLQNPFSPGYLGLRQGDRKFVHVIHTNTTECYDLAQDPGESKNISEQLPRECAEATALVRTVQSMVDRAVKENRLAP